MKENKLIEIFDKPKLYIVFNCYNEPSKWELKNNQLQVFSRCRN